MNEISHIRNYRPDDLEGLTGLIVRQNRLGGRKETPADVARSLERPGFDPAKDLFVAETDGRLIGYLKLTPQALIDTGLLQGWIEPSSRKKGIAKNLLAGILARTRELNIGSVRTAISQDNRTARDILPKLGFKYVRRYLELQLDPETVPAEMPLTAGLSFSRLSREHIPALAELLNRSFHSHWNYHPYDGESLGFDLTMYDRSPDDVLLACIGRGTIGCCWMETGEISGIAGTERQGVIDMMGIDPEYQGKGYGKSTLLAGTAYLRKKDVRNILLSVDSENKPARALYFSLGFTEYSSTLWYERAAGYETQT